MKSFLDPSLCYPQYVDVLSQLQIYPSLPCFAILDLDLGNMASFASWPDVKLHQ